MFTLAIYQTNVPTAEKPSIYWVSMVLRSGSQAAW